MAYKNDFIQLPVVDIWANKLLAQLKDRFPELEYKNRKYRYSSLLDVTTSHCYAFRGLVRSLAGLILDLGTFKLKRVVQRIAVWLKIRKDPYDNFTTLMEYHKEFPCRSIFFFQFADYSTYDKNVSPDNNRFRYLIKSVADYSTVSLAASYSSFSDIELLKQEKKRLSEVIHRPVQLSRMRYNRADVPITYRNLVEAEFSDDYTMGYTHVIGFKAGTCTTFNFYDIHMEIQQPIKIHPFAVHDYALTNIKSKEEALSKIDAIYRKTQEANGEFTTVFSNELLGGTHKVDWLDLYRTILSRYHA